MDFKLRNVWFNLEGSGSKKFLLVEEGKPDCAFSNLELKGAVSKHVFMFVRQWVENPRPFTDKWAGFFFVF